MSWTRQLWHVLAKDLREQRWWLLIYVMLLVAGAGPAWSGSWTGTESTFRSGMAGVARAVMALLVCYNVFRDEAPLAPGAYWAVLPLSRAALLGAKLLFVGVVAIVLPLLVHGTAWRSFGVPLIEIPAIWWRFEASLVLVLIALAAITAGVRSGRLVALLCFAAAVANAQVLQHVRQLTPPDVTMPLLRLAAAGALLLTLYRLLVAYKRRRDSAPTRVLLVAAGTLLFVMPGLLASVSTIRTDALETLLRTSQLNVRQAQPDEFWRSNAVRVMLTSPPIDRSVRSVATCIHSASKRSSEFSTAKNGANRRIVVPRLPAALRWRTDPLDQDARSGEWASLEFFTADAAWRARCDGVAEYHLSVTRDSVVDSMPARDGTIRESTGRRYRVRHPNDNPGALTFGVTVASVPGYELGTPADASGRTRPLKFVLVHAGRGEAIALNAFDLSTQPPNNSLPVRTERFETFAPEQTDRPKRYSWETLQFASEAEGLAWLNEAMLYVIKPSSRLIDITAHVERALEMSSTTSPQPQAVP